MSDDVEQSLGKTIYRFIAHWASLSAKFLSLQLAIHGVNFVAGLVTIWSLAKSEYALVTIAITLLGAMVTLSNLGITIGVTSLGGRCAQDRTRFGSVVATALRLRRALALLVFPLVAIVMIVSLHRTEASATDVTAITATVLAIAACELSATLLSAALLLRDRVFSIQVQELVSAGLRLAIIANLAWFGWLSAASAIVATLIGAWVRNRVLLRIARKEIDLAAPEVIEDRKEITRLTRLEAPNAIFYCFQGQVTILIMTWFGSVTQIAEFGALGRLAFLTSLISSFFFSLLIPRFNRLQERGEIKRRYVGTLGFALGIAVALVSFCYFFPGALLWFLGPQYVHLQAELPLMFGSNAISFVIGIAWAMNSSKAWIAIIARGNIPLTILTQIGLASVCALDTLAGVIWFSLLSQLPVLLLLICDAVRGIWSTPSPTPH